MHSTSGTRLKLLAARMHARAGDSFTVRSNDLLCDRMAQGTGDARYFTARLTPVHRDTAAEQAAALPALAAFPARSRAAAAARLAPTDAPSFLEWCRALGVEPPLAPDNVAAAMAQLAVS